MPTDFGPRKISSTWGAKFHEPGATLRGLILAEPVEQQATDMNTNQPKVWDDGKPVQQWIYDVLLVDETKCSASCHWCAQATPKTGEDPGTRRVYANWSQHKQLQNAIYSVDRPRLGGLLVLKFVENDMDKKKPGKAAPKVWQAAYRNPTEAEEARVDDHLGTGSVPSNGSLSDEDASALLTSEPITLDAMKGIAGK